jgi:uncharacterized membrane protein YphA (DoxX/SURF4 family)
MSNVQSLSTDNRAPFRWEIALWSAQILLALLFGAAGVMKTFLAPEALVPMGLTYATEIPYWLLRFIGVCELAGAVGVILPALTRIMPIYTSLAALGFVMIQVLAIGFHIMRGEFAEMAAMNLSLLALSAFVLWGREAKAPIKPRRFAAPTAA